MANHRLNKTLYLREASHDLGDASYNKHTTHLLFFFTYSIINKTAASWACSSLQHPIQSLSNVIDSNMQKINENNMTL